MSFPLFPLNTVLFPGCRLDLQIFEARYLDMIGRCMKQNGGFGVVAIVEGEEVGDAPLFIEVYEGDPEVADLATIRRRQIGGLRAGALEVAAGIRGLRHECQVLREQLFLVGTYCENVVLVQAAGNLVVPDGASAELVQIAAVGIGLAAHEGELGVRGGVIGRGAGHALEGKSRRRFVVVVIVHRDFGFGAGGGGGPLWP